MTKEEHLKDMYLETCVSKNGKEYKRVVLVFENGSKYWQFLDFKQYHEMKEAK